MLAGKIGYFRATAHPEAASWRTRVIANGGTVSAATFAAVEAFCRAVDTAGIRSRFYRLNLFCGTGLASALVPLYRGQSLGGTQFGGTTDANTNLVAGDYNETGTSAGFRGGTGKYINTGLKANALPQTDRHISAVVDVANALGSQYAIGCDNFGSGSNFYWGVLRGTASGTAMVRAANVAANSPNVTVTGNAQILASGNGSASVYSNGALATTGPGGVFTAANLDVWVVGLNRGGSLGDTWTGRVQSYSIGLGMTAAQASSFYTAMQAFQTALTRAA